VKKVVLTAFCVILTLGMVSSSVALIFTDTQDLDTVLGEGPGASLIWPSELTYYHLTPDDFQVPYDVVNSATLDISGYWIDDGDDPVEVKSTLVGYLNKGGGYGLTWSWSSMSVDLYDAPSNSMFDVSPAFSSWTTGASLEVLVTANGSCSDGILELAQSTFMLDYDNRTGGGNMGTQSVPEPANMFLLGTGFLGLACCGRKRFFS